MISHNAFRKHARLPLLLWALSFQCATAQQCYYPDGSLASGQNECILNGEAFSQCCPQGWTCDANGLCKNPANNDLGRYSCTDKSWGSSCPNFCQNTGFTGTDQAVLQCSDSRYCCDGDGSSGNCCNDGGDRFTLAAVGQTPESSGSSGSSSSAPASSSAAPSSSASPSSSQPASSSSASSGTSSSTVISTTTSASTESASGRPISTVVETSLVTSIGTSTSTAGTTSSSSNNSTADHSSSSSSNHKSLAIGLGVGIPVGIAALALPILFLLFRRRRRRSLLKKERRRTQVAEAYEPEPKSPQSPVPPEYANDAGFYSAKHVQPPSELPGNTAAPYQAINSDPVELSAGPKTPPIPGANPSQPPSEGRLVGGLAYAHRAPGRNSEYQAYPAELPSPT